MRDSSHPDRFDRINGLPANEKVKSGESDNCSDCELEWAPVPRATTVVDP